MNRFGVDMMESDGSGKALQKRVLGKIITPPVSYLLKPNQMELYDYSKQEMPTMFLNDFGI